MDPNEIIIPAIGGVLYGTVAAHGVFFLFNNLPDSYFRNEKAHIGTGPQKGQRIHSYGSRYLRLLFAFLFMSCFITAGLQGLVDTTAIWILTLILFCLWFYGEIPITLLLSLLLCAGAMVPYMEGVLDMLTGGALLGGLTLILSLITRLATKMDQNMAETVMLGTAIGLVTGFLGAFLVGSASVVFTISLMPGFNRQARRAGYTGYNKESMEKILAAKEPVYVAEWFLSKLGRTPLALVMCVIAIMALVISVPFTESFREYVPWLYG